MARRLDSSNSITAENTPLEFPCVFPVKVMLISSDGARRDALETVSAHVGFDAERDVRRRASRNGRYESVTISVRVESREQLEGIYRDLRRLEAVVMTL
jgi:putative lipoic acid-binding regulatory protein